MDMIPKRYMIDGILVQIEASQNADFSVVWDASIGSHLTVSLRCFDANNFSLHLREGDESQHAGDYLNSIDAVAALMNTIRNHVGMYKASTELAQTVDTLLDEWVKKHL